MASKMLALGTTDYLRRKHGDSYYVHLVHRDAPHTSDQDMDRIRSWITMRMPNARVERATYHGQLRFEVPTSPSQMEQYDQVVELSDKGVDRDIETKKGVSSAAITATSTPKLFAALESAKQELGIEYYSVSRATLDQVFLNIVGKHNVEEEDGENISKKKTGTTGRGLLPFLGP